MLVADVLTLVEQVPQVRKAKNVVGMFGVGRCWQRLRQDVCGVVIAHTCVRIYYHTH